jgi:hypothetical protein
MLGVPDGCLSCGLNIGEWVDKPTFGEVRNAGSRRAKRGRRLVTVEAHVREFLQFSKRGP